MAQNEATMLVAAALFPTVSGTAPSPVRGGAGPSVSPTASQSSLSTKTTPPGLALLNFWESLEGIKNESRRNASQEEKKRYDGARRGEDVTPQKKDRGTNLQSESHSLSASSPPPPMSAAEVDIRLTNTIHRHIIDPALVPQLLQPTKLAHDIVPKLKRLMEQRVALETLRSNLTEEGKIVREKTGDRSLFACEAKTNKVEQEDGESDSPNDYVKRSEGEGEQAEVQEGASSTTCSPPEIKEESTIDANTDVKKEDDNASERKPIVGQQGCGLLKHPDLVAWESYEEETLHYIAQQHAELDAVASTLRESYLLWRNQVELFRQQQQQY